jgi:Zn-dependent protease with chaperone function
MKSLKSWLIVALVMFGVPAGGWAVGFGLTAKMERDFVNAVLALPQAQAQHLTQADILPFGDACERADFRAQMASPCGTYENLQLLQRASICTAVGAFCTVLLVVVTARLCQGRRELLARTFGIEIRVVLISICILLLAQGAIFVYALYTAGSVLAHEVPIGILGGVGFGAVIGSYAMIKTALRVSSRFKAFAIGTESERSHQPRLWSFVDEIAAKVGGRPPKNIVVGIEPNFYATAADVQLAGTSKILQGETLYLSTSLMRILRLEELRAVIGHELGHFKGSDTEYTLRFLPIYRGMQSALRSLGSLRGVSLIAMWPAMTMLQICLNEFAKAERAIGREREIEADKSGAVAASAASLVSALMKCAIFTPVWPPLVKTAIAELNQGRMLANASSAFEEQAKRLLVGGDAKDLIAKATSSRQPHPTDTHPTLEARAAALAVPLQDGDFPLGAPGDPALALLDNAEAIEQQVSQRYAQVLVAVKAAKPPPQVAPPAAATQIPA